MQRVCPSMIGKNAAPLFVDTACYPWHARDAWTIAAGWAGCRAAGARAMTRLLGAPSSVGERAPIDTNAGSCRERGFPGA